MGKQMAISCGGTLNCWEEGERVFFRAEFPGTGGEQYKVWLVGSGGNEMLLGTTADQGKTRRLFRTIACTQLKYSGCWPVQRIKVGRVTNRQRGGIGEWYCEEHPERLFNKTGENSVQLGAMLCRQYVEGFELAAPFHDNRPLGLNHLFCFAVLKPINGKQYLVWRFNREGEPEFSAR